MEYNLAKKLMSRTHKTQTSFTCFMQVKELVDGQLKTTTEINFEVSANNVDELIDLAVESAKKRVHELTAPSEDGGENED